MSSCRSQKHKLKCFYSSWESGHCYTYNPRDKLEPVFSNRIGLFLGHTKLFNFESNNFKNFFIYIHEKGQFWPREEFYPISILPNEYKVLRFQKKIKTSKKETNKCNDNKKFSFTSCLKNYIKNEVGCSLQLFVKQDSYPKCRTKSQLLQIKVKTTCSWLHNTLTAVLMQGITTLGQKHSNEKS